VGSGSWPTWNSPDGAYITYVSANVKAIGAVPMFTLYQMASRGEGNLGAIDDATFMASYWAQVKLMYQKIGATGLPTLVNLEPDFWGFVLTGAPGGDPTKLPARVSMVPECASQPDTAAGLAGCLLTLGRTYAPKAKIGSRRPSGDGMPRPSATSWRSWVRTRRTSSWDRRAIVTPAALKSPRLCRSARDAAAARSTGTRTTSRPPTSSRTLPVEHRAKHARESAHAVLADADGRALATPGGTPGHYRDNHVHYMLTHPTEYTAAGVFAIVFSGGGSTSASITTDGGQFARMFQAYLANPAPFPR
jgi:hypothetical protein